MGRKGFGKKKNPDAGLPQGFREAVAGMSTDEIRKKISDITVLDLAMRKVLEDDDKVQTAKAVLKNLMEPYREDFKSFKAQLKCCKAVLDDKNGGATSAKLEEEHAAKKTASASPIKEVVISSDFGKKVRAALDTLDATLTGMKSLGSDKIDPVS